MSQEAIEAVRLAYDGAFARRHLGDLRDLLAEGFTWTQRDEWPGRAVYGRDDMEQLWADLDETYSEFSLLPVEYAGAGEYVVVTINTSARLQGSDERIEGTTWHVWRVRDGIALEGRSYTSKREAEEAAGLSGA